VKAMGPPAAVLQTGQLDRVYDFPRDHVHRGRADEGDG
jgi:hypothetical protein